MAGRVGVGRAGSKFSGVHRSIAARLPLDLRGERAWSALRAPRAGLARLWANRRSRLALLGTILAIPLLVGGWMLLRSSPLVAVRHVHVSGVRGRDAAAIESALRSAGRRMSTLAVDLAALRAAVAPFAVVREVRASANFPHTLNVSVVEQPPVAALLVSGARTAVAADGVVLGQALLSSRLPTVDANFEPRVGQRVREAGVGEALEVLGAAPHALAVHVSSASTGKEGLTLKMDNGLLVLFGDATRPHAKWRALERVLIDEGSTGASYIDVRLPERPAAGGYPGGVPPLGGTAGGEGSPGGGAGAGGEPSVEALAEALRANSGVGTGAATAGAGATAEGSEGSSAATSAGGGEASSTPPTGGEEAAAQAPAPSAPSPSAPSAATQASGGAASPEAGG